MRGKRDAYRGLVIESEGKRPLGKPSCRWDGNNKPILKRESGGAWTGFVWLRI
jgi:hypothetical protein